MVRTELTLGSSSCQGCYLPGNYRTGLCCLITALASLSFSRPGDEVSLSHPCAKAQDCIHPLPDCQIWWKSFRRFLACIPISAV